MPSLDQPPQIGMVVRSLRLERGWTQQELAARAGVTAQTISNIETGRSGRVYVDTVESLAAAFGVTVSAIDPRYFAEAVERNAKTAVQREAIELALQLPDADLKSIIEAMRARRERRTKLRRGGRR